MRVRKSCARCRKPRVPPKTKNPAYLLAWKADRYCSRVCFQAAHGIPDPKSPVATPMGE